MKLSVTILCVVIAVYIKNTESIIPKDCTGIIDECKKWGKDVKDALISRCCTKCGKKIPFMKAKPFVDAATKELVTKILAYVKAKIPKLPKDVTPEWICSVAGSIEEAFNHHDDLCKFDENNPKHKKEIENCKSIAINKAMGKAMKLLPLAGECKKGKGIPTHIMHDIPVKKAVPPPIDIIKLMDEKCTALCKTL